MNDVSDIDITFKVKKPDLTYYDLDTGGDFTDVKLFVYSEGKGLLDKGARVAATGYTTMAHSTDGSGDSVLTLELQYELMDGLDDNDCLYGEIICYTATKQIASKADIGTVDKLMKETRNG